MRLGASIALFKPMDIAFAAPYIKAAGFSGTTVSFNVPFEHFKKAVWRDELRRLKMIADDTGLELMSTGTGNHDPEYSKFLFESAAALSIGVVCTGPNAMNKPGVTYNQAIDELGAMAVIAQEFKVYLVCKYHDGHCIHNTEEALAMMDDIKNPYFGADIDPFHVFNAGESLAEAAKTLSPFLKYAHVQDSYLDEKGCNMKGQVRPPLGMGNADIPAYLKALMDGGYNGPLMFEMYTKDMDLITAVSMTAQGHGYLNACFKILGK